MKKNVLMLLLCLALPVFLSSCGDDDDKPDEVSIDNTVWNAKDADANEDYVLTFNIQTFVMRIVKYNEKGSLINERKLEGDFQFSNPKITLKIPNPHGGWEYINLTLEGNNISYPLDSKTIKFTKKQ